MSALPAQLDNKTNSRVQRSPSFPNAAEHDPLRDLRGMAVMCAPSLRKILPSTSPNQPGHPRAVYIGAISSGNLRLPRLSVKPAAE